MKVLFSQESHAGLGRRNEKLEVTAWPVIPVTTINKLSPNDLYILLPVTFSNCESSLIVVLVGHQHTGPGESPAQGNLGNLESKQQGM